MKAGILSPRVDPDRGVGSEKFATFCVGKTTSRTIRQEE